ncbi:MAG: DUF1573 domain-containing protein [Terrimicrobiaceae bacterium]
MSFNISLLSIIFCGFFSMPILASENSLDWITTKIDITLKSDSKSELIKFGCRNISEARIILQVVKASCGCLSVSKETLTVEPGQTVDIDVTMDVRLVHSSETKYILVKTSVPNSPFVRLAVTVHPYSKSG